MAKPSEVIEQLKELPENIEIMLDIWSAADVRQAAHNWNLDIDDKDIPMVMKKVMEELDPDLGITFDQVSETVLDVVYPSCEYDETSGMIWYDPEEFPEGEEPPT